MNCIDTIKVDKYTVVIGSGDGEFIFKALRNNEKWIGNLSTTEASNLIMVMAYEIQELRSQLVSMNK